MKKKILALMLAGVLSVGQFSVFANAEDGASDGGSSDGGSTISNSSDNSSSDNSSSDSGSGDSSSSDSDSSDNSSDDNSNSAPEDRPDAPADAPEDRPDAPADAPEDRPDAPADAPEGSSKGETNRGNQSAEDVAALDDASNYLDMSDEDKAAYIGDMTAEELAAFLDTVAKAEEIAAMEAEKAEQQAAAEAERQAWADAVEAYDAMTDEEKVAYLGTLSAEDLKLFNAALGEAAKEQLVQKMAEYVNSYNNMTDEEKIAFLDGLDSSQLRAFQEALLAAEQASVDAAGQASGYYEIWKSLTNPDEKRAFLEAMTTEEQQALRALLSEDEITAFDLLLISLMGYTTVNFTQAGPLVNPVKATYEQPSKLEEVNRNTKTLELTPFVMMALQREPKKEKTQIVTTSSATILTIITAAAEANEISRAADIIVGATEEDDNIVMSKTVTPDTSNDGEYTIELKTFTTGSVSESLTAPADIILVLDQSESMYYDFDGNDVLMSGGNYVDITGTSYNNGTAPIEQDLDGWEDTRQYAMLNAVELFIKAIAEDAKTQSEIKENEDFYHTVSVVAYSSAYDSQSYYDEYSNYTDALWEGADAFTKNSDLGTGYSSNVTGQPASQFYVTLDSTAASVLESYEYGSDSTYNYNKLYSNSAGDNGTYADELLDWVWTLDAEKGTPADDGMKNAYTNVLAANSENIADRNQVVILFSDGAPKDASAAAFEVDRADAAIAAAYDMKDKYEATVYGVGIFTGANAEEISGTTSTAVNATWNVSGSSSLYASADSPAINNRFMNFVSSNAPAENATGASGTTGYAAEDLGASWNYNNGTTGYYSISNAYNWQNDAYYLTADNASDLTTIFASIASAAVSTPANLDETAQMQDYVTSYFEFPEIAVEGGTRSFSASDVTLSIYDCTSIEVNETSGNTYTFSNGATYTTSGKEGTTNEDGSVSYAVSGGVEGTTELTVTVDLENKGVFVDGFDYDGNAVMVVNGATPDSGTTYSGTKVTGSQLVVSFNITATDGFIGGNDVETNKSTSGIYTYTAKDGSVGEYYSLVTQYAIPDTNVDLEFDLTTTDQTIYLGNRISLWQILQINGHDIYGEANAYVNLSYELYPENTLVDAYKDSDGNITMNNSKPSGTPDSGDTATVVFMGSDENYYARTITGSIANNDVKISFGLINSSSGSIGEALTDEAVTKAGLDYLADFVITSGLSAEDAAKVLLEDGELTNVMPAEDTSYDVYCMVESLEPDDASADVGDLPVSALDTMVYVLHPFVEGHDAFVDYGTSVNLRTDGTSPISWGYMGDSGNDVALVDANADYPPTVYYIYQNLITGETFKAPFEVDFDNDGKYYTIEGYDHNGNGNYDATDGDIMAYGTDISSYVAVATLSETPVRGYDEAASTYTASETVNILNGTEDIGDFSIGADGKYVYTGVTQSIFLIDVNGDGIYTSETETISSAPITRTAYDGDDGDDITYTIHDTLDADVVGTRHYEIIGFEVHSSDGYANSNLYSTQAYEDDTHEGGESVTGNNVFSFYVNDYDIEITKMVPKVEYDTYPQNFVFDVEQIQYAYENGVLEDEAYFEDAVNLAEDANSVAETAYAINQIKVTMLASEVQDDTKTITVDDVVYYVCSKVVSGLYAGLDTTVKEDTSWSWRYEIGGALLVTAPDAVLYDSITDIYSDDVYHDGDADVDIHTIGTNAVASYIEDDDYTSTFNSNYNNYIYVSKSATAYTSAAEGQLETLLGSGTQSDPDVDTYTQIDSDAKSINSTVAEDGTITVNYTHNTYITGFPYYFDSSVVDDAKDGNFNGIADTLVDIDGDGEPDEEAFVYTDRNGDGYVDIDIIGNALVSSDIQNGDYIEMDVPFDFNDDGYIDMVAAVTYADSYTFDKYTPYTGRFRITHSLTNGTYPSSVSDSYVGNSDASDEGTIRYTVTEAATKGYFVKSNDEDAFYINQDGNIEAYDGTLVYNRANKYLNGFVTVTDTVTGATVGADATTYSNAGVITGLGSADKILLENTYVFPSDSVYTYIIPKPGNYTPYAEGDIVAGDTSKKVGSTDVNQEADKYYFADSGEEFSASSPGAIVAIETQDGGNIVEHLAYSSGLIVLQDMATNTTGDDYEVLNLNIFDTNGDGTVKDALPLSIRDSSRYFSSHGSLIFSGDDAKPATATIYAGIQSEATVQQYLSAEATEENVYGTTGGVE